MVNNRPDKNRKWFYGKNAKLKAHKEAKIRSKKGKKYVARKTLGGGYWVGTIEQEKKMHI